MNSRIDFQSPVKVYLKHITLCALVALSFLKPTMANDNYTYYVVSDLLDISDYFKDYKEGVGNDDNALSASLLEYDAIMKAGYGRRYPMFQRVLLHTDETGELKQYIVYLSILADKDNFNCEKIIEVYDNEFLPLKPEFYINNCSKSALNLYRSFNYSSEY